MKRIIFLEDNFEIANGVKAFLEQKDFSVKILSRISSFEKEDLKLYDLILMDCNLPDGDATLLAKKIVSLKKPFLFVTVRDSERNIIKGLELGAEDYITKPFSLPILFARIKTVLRHYETDNDSVIVFEKLILDTERKKLMIENESIELTKKEYELINLLLQNPGKLMTRDLLLSKIWDNKGDFVEDNTLSVTIKRLREKLGDYGDKIHTIRGMGYRFDE